MRRNLKCVAKFVVILALKFKFALSILPVYKIKLVFLVFVKIALLYRLIYHFVVDDKIIQIIDKARSVKWKINETSSKSKMISTNLNNVLTKVYSIMISKINALFYSIKLDTKLMEAFGY